MKLKLNFILFALLGAMGLQSCDNDVDVDLNSVPAPIKSAFAEKYPNAMRVEWEKEKGYYVADFYDTYETSAWFTSDGTWHRTETDFVDLTAAAIPDLVKEAFSKSEYSTWRVDDVDRIERQDAETVYVIEVEKKNKEVRLTYSAAGILK